MCPLCSVAVRVIAFIADAAALPAGPVVTRDIRNRSASRLSAPVW
jgi:hypothetical protein